MKFRLIFNHMVERNIYLDGLFGSLADPIRRDILRRLMHAHYTVSQIAAYYDVSLAAIAKHLSILEKAKLVTKRRQGRERIVSIAPLAMKDASHYLRQYEVLWNHRFDALDNLLLKEDI
jgi:DNA-binding transcriptional ArsR family regulator